MAACVLLSIWLLLALISVHWIFALSTVAAYAASLNITSTTNSSCFAADLAALRSFAANYASATITEYWKGDDCCSWEGVTCSTVASLSDLQPAVHRRVSELALVGDFTGPEALTCLCGLSALSSLSLYESSVFFHNLIYLSPDHSIGEYDPIPEERYRLSIDIRVSIPECMGSSLTNLETLELSGFESALVGSIPLSFSRLRSLRELSLRGDGLSGPFPSSLLSELPNLTSLDLRFNSFSGSVPACDAPHLQYLDLSSNALSGSIPACDAPHLQYLGLSSNAFSGSIPACDAPHLQYLDLSYNAFSGNISDFFSHSKLPSLSSLDASGNSFSADIPPFKPSQFSSLKELSLNYNNIAGSFPKSLCELVALQKLDLSFNALTGRIPSQCQALANLSTLDLSHNRLTGPFPSWVGFLSNLQRLDLSNNNFTGRLPDDWHKLSRLSVLGLSGNSLVPDHPNDPVLPLWLFRVPLTNLLLGSMRLQPADLDCGSQLLLLNTTIRWLDLSENNLNASVLWCLSAPHNNFTLYRLYMSGNPLALTLDGMDPVKLLLMQKSLEILDLSSCELNGSLTHMFTKGLMSPIQELHLANNGLVGEIPPQLGNLSYLLVLDLSNNSFTRFSPFREYKSPTTVIETLILSNNQLTGDLSSTLLNLYNYSSLDELGQQCRLIEVDLSNNSLTGGIPISLGKCLPLWRLKLNDNRLEGIDVPDELFSNMRLQTLSLSNNQFNGSIPSSIRKQKGLVFLDLSHNSFVGDLQTVFGDSSESDTNFANLRVLLLAHNHFTGSIPISLGKSTPALQVIDFSDNSLIGHIPDTLLQLPAFRIIQDTSIASLSVQGTLYEEFRIYVKGDYLTFTYALKVFTSLDLSGNHLSGPIPVGFGVLSGLVNLNLSRNNLSGHIPSDLGKLSALQCLDLSYNQLSGSIPTSFYNLTGLEVFNVSFNEGLGGPIPRNQPQFEVSESYMGDPNLCGEPTLHACGGPPFTNQPMDRRIEEESFFSSWIDEWVSIPALCLGNLVGFLGSIILIKRWWPRP